MTAGKHDHSFPRRMRPGFANPFRPEGRRECRVMASPMARLQQKTQAAVTTGLAGSTGTPCAMAYGLYAFSPVSGLDSHRRSAKTSRRAWSQRREIRTARFHRPRRCASSPRM